MGCKSESYVFFIFNDENEGDGDGEDDDLYRKMGMKRKVMGGGLYRNEGQKSGIEGE
jgi:hypothetical protein